MGEPQIYELSLVFIGDFNPSIIQPIWLSSRKLIQETEGENADIELIHKEVSKFHLDWVGIEVTQQRFSFRSTSQSHFRMVKDLATSIFKKLNETPLINIGINHSFHYQLNESAYYDVGERLVPFSKWDGIMSDPRLKLLEIIENPRNDSFNGHYRIRVSQSELLAKYGVCININDHFSVGEHAVKSTKDSKEIIDILENCWDSSTERANNTIKELWKNLKL